MTDSGISEHAVTYCSKTCYYDDTVCSSGEKIDGKYLIVNGFVYIGIKKCTVTGYTAAGSVCGICANNQCGEGLYNEEEKTQKEAQNYSCEESTPTAAGSPCYQCWDDRCQEGYTYSAEEGGCSLPYRNYQTYAGHCCYQNYTGSTCTTQNNKFTTPGECETVANGTLDPKNNASMAYCTPCKGARSESDGGGAQLMWYPTCRNGYKTTPSQDNLGDICCSNGNNNYETISNVTEVTLNLGHDVCHTVSQNCGSRQKVDMQYCQGALCEPELCNTQTYRYWSGDSSGRPENTTPVAPEGTQSCQDKLANCQPDSLARYPNYQCSTGYCGDGSALNPSACKEVVDTCSGQGYFYSNVARGQYIYALPEHASFDTSSNSCSVQVKDSDGTCGEAYMAYRTFNCNDDNYCRNLDSKRGGSCDLVSADGACPSDQYPYTQESLPENSAASGHCTITRKDNIGDCQETKRFADWTCDEGYCKESNACTKTKTANECMADGYLYEKDELAEANKRGVGTPCRVLDRNDDDGTCFPIVDYDEYYADWECITGYTKVGDECEEIEPTCPYTSRLQCLSNCTGSCEGSGNCWRCRKVVSAECVHGYGSQEECEQAYPSSVGRCCQEATLVPSEQCWKWRFGDEACDAIVIPNPK